MMAETCMYEWCGEVCAARHRLKSRTGVEPVWSAWKADARPLGQRDSGRSYRLLPVWGIMKKNPIVFWTMEAAYGNRIRLAGLGSRGTATVRMRHQASGEGVEPPARRLTAARSASELPGQVHGHHPVHRRKKWILTIPLIHHIRDSRLSESN